MYHRPNVKRKTIKLLEDNTEKIQVTLGLAMTVEILNQRHNGRNKTDKLDFIKIKKLQLYKRQCQDNKKISHRQRKYEQKKYLKKESYPKYTNNLMEKWVKDLKKEKKKQTHQKRSSDDK